MQNRAVHFLHRLKVKIGRRQQSVGHILGPAVGKLGAAAILIATGKEREQKQRREEEKEFQRAYIAHMYRYFGYGMWLVFEKQTGQIIGRAGLEHREYNEVVELELGYLIGKKYQGKGYASEAISAVIDYMKRVHEITEYVVEISPST